MASISRIEWTKLYARLATKRAEYGGWQQGEHLSIIGPTGAGKTHLMLALLPIRDYVSFYVSKAADDTLDRMRHDGYIKLRAFSERKSWEHKLQLWPSYNKPGDEVKQQAVFYQALMTQFGERNWTIAIDEVSYFVDLKLTSQQPSGGLLGSFWKQGRSLGLTVVGATQRPAGVPQLMYSMPTHLFLFQFRSELDLKKLSGIGGYVERREIERAFGSMRKHEFLYIHAPSGAMAISKVE